MTDQNKRRSPEQRVGRGRERGFLERARSCVVLPRRRLQQHRTLFCAGSLVLFRESAAPAEARKRNARTHTERRKGVAPAAAACVTQSVANLLREASAPAEITPRFRPVSRPSRNQRGAKTVRDRHRPGRTLRRSLQAIVSSGARADWLVEKNRMS